MPAARYEARIDRVHAWSASTRSFFLRVTSGGRMPFSPGQFISLALPLGESPPLVRPYSLASDPDDELLEICVDLVPGGLGSAYLFALTAGAALDFKGPFGTFCVDEPPAAPLVFVGDATGIAPIRAMLRRVLARPGDAPVHVVQGGRAFDALLYRDELEAATAAHARLTWEPVLAADGTRDAALEARVAARYVHGDADRTRHFWICAVGDVVRRLREAVRGAGYERRAVRYEQW